MLLREQLVHDCAGVILDAVRSESGRLQFVSEESKVNRKFFTRKAFRTVRWFRLIRILYCLSMKMSCKDFTLLGSRLFQEIWLRAEIYDYDLLDERQ